MSDAAVKMICDTVMIVFGWTLFVFVILAFAGAFSKD